MIPWFLSQPFQISKVYFPPAFPPADQMIMCHLWEIPLIFLCIYLFYHWVNCWLKWQLSHGSITVPEGKMSFFAIVYLAPHIVLISPFHAENSGQVFFFLSAKSIDWLLFCSSELPNWCTVQGNRLASAICSLITLLLYSWSTLHGAALEGHGEVIPSARSIIQTSTVSGI